MLLLKLAFRNIFRQRRRSILTALSIGGGYLLCALSFSLLEGSYNNLITLFTLSKTGHVQIHQDNYLERPKVHKAIPDYERIGQALDNDSQILAYTYRVFSPALAYSNNGNQPAQIVGIDPEKERNTTLIAKKIKSGNYLSNTPNADGYFQAMIGVGIHESLKLDIGDELIVISQGADGSVANDIFIVGAIIGTKDSFEKFQIILPLNAAQEFLSLYGKVHEIALVLDQYQKAQQVASELTASFPELTVSPWQTVEADFYNSMESDKRGNHVTLGIILFIVFIGVLNTVLMTVLERTREFGVLKAIGSQPRTILILVTLESTLLAILSIAVAFLVSLPIVFWFAHTGFLLSEPIDVGGIAFSAFKGEMSVPVFAIPAVLVTSFAFLVSIPPGIRAAKISPTQAMGSH